MVFIKSRYTNTSNGYIKLYLSDGRIIEEHRFKMEQKLGRRLDFNEVVHHKNEIKHDNRLENLELISRSLHASHHTRPVTMVTLECNNCKKEFDKEKRQIKPNQKIFFCNRVCMGKKQGYQKKNNAGSAGAVPGLQNLA